MYKSYFQLVPFTLPPLLVFSFPDKDLKYSNSFSFAFAKFSLGSHVSSNSEYPFHRTRNYSWPRTTRYPRMASTSYSFSPASRRIGSYAGWSPLAGFSWLLWNTLWMFQLLGSSSLQASVDTCCTTLKGPVHLAASLRVPTLRGRFAVERKTCIPSAN